MPAKLIRHEIVRPKLACPCGQAGVSIAPLPAQVIEQGQAGAGLVAQVMLSKYDDHCPLYRQQNQVLAAERKHELESGDAEDLRIYRLIEFRRGKRTGSKWKPFCPKCHMPVGASWVKGKPTAICSAHCGWRAVIPDSLTEISKELGDDAA